MVKRIKVQLNDVADVGNLYSAFHKAARAKRGRSEVKQFTQLLERNINLLSADIRSERLPYAKYRSFLIRDPKLRVIHAASFADRVFHHALMNFVSPVLENSMVSSSYACRPGMGAHQAIATVQKNLRKYKYYVKTDIEQYFPSINQNLLLNVLQRRFKGRAIAEQFKRILSSYEFKPGYGLPIGSLCSQYFANYYLDGADRFLLNHPALRAHVRYMDDVLWWCDNRAQAKQVLAEYKDFLRVKRDLVLKPNVQIQPSTHGVRYCGFVIKQGTIQMSLRRKRRYQERRRYWEQQYSAGQISAATLQQNYASVLAIAQGTDSLNWRKQQHALHPAPDV